MRVRFLASMGSLVLVDFAITGILIVISGRIDVLGYDLAVNLFSLGLLNIGGAWWLFRPIQRFLDHGEGSETVLERVESLPRLASLWVVLCTAIYCGSAFALGIFMPSDIPTETIPTKVLVSGLIWFVFVYAVYYAFYIYFLINDFSLDLKRQLAARGLHMRALNGRILYKLVAAMLVAAFMPSLLIAFDLSIFRPLRAAQGLSVDQTIFLDLIASAFLVAVSLVFVTRSLLRPMDALTLTMQSLRQGQLGVSAPVLSGDELGVLAERFNEMIEGLREREFIRETFGRFVPRKVASTLLENRGALEPQLRTATILFADIENFTQIAENQAPETVFRMLNEYFTEAVQPIDRYGGVVNQFQGDAILVTFNVPVADPLHADNAVSAAIEMMNAIQARTFSGIPLRARIGIHTGEVIGGAVGSDERLSYTVHGDAVNLASRLEHLNKELGTRLLVSETTHAELTKSYDLALAGEFALRGKSTKIGVYTLKPTEIS
ncbi:adenylate/guanylate cyclase domain-containing protein [Hwanghaeella grinnelliae]|uniref:Adenylate/guanylate cyclase domain-containing protein n=1 Tax=Hwanghaeella grinnelliae TaxID=2500179 RepID=A0A437QYK0_9PROT|nr:adenylate/guanylate cyclase domain-containing protein [Hwanghaeella grinnelliae]RVU39571.1 adenylate/guanylate cyclase domain-containing protein [Hwanghaeella grinnelliae]